MARTPDALEIRNFAQIRHARIEFGDLTVLVGPQATGKSLILQILKTVLDGHHMRQRLREAGVSWSSPQELYDLSFGEGMGRSVRPATKVQWHGRATRNEAIESSAESVFYVPAQRALVLAEGWPLRFELLDERAPIVARIFSDSLYRLLSTQRRRDLFPDRRRLSATLVRLIDQAILHGGRVGLRRRGSASKLELLVGGRSDGIQFPAWSTGQREFTPLLLGLYSVLDKPSVKWIVLEEPEMGLHPRGIEVAMLLVLELLRRQLRVVLSTHSLVVLEVIWGIQRLAERGAEPHHLLECFGVQSRKDLIPLARRALAANYRVFALDYKDKGVESRDITGLDPASANPSEAFWGGLTELGSRVSDMVTRLSR